MSPEKKSPRRLFAGPHFFRNFPESFARAARRSVFSRFLFVWLIFLLLALPPERAGATTGREVMEKVLARKGARTLSAKLEMVVTDERRKRKSLTLALFRARGKQVTRTVLFGRSPRKVLNIGYLAHDNRAAGRQDRQWLYLPRTRETRQIEAEERASNFLVSDFTFADLTLPDPDLYTFKLLAEPELDGVKTWQVEMLPGSPEVAQTGAYAKSVLWVRQDNHVLVRAIHWPPQGGLVKYLEVTELQEREGIWLVTEWRMTTMWGRAPIHSTVLRLSEIKLGQRLRKGLFEPERLSKGFR